MRRFFAIVILTSIAPLAWAQDEASNETEANESSSEEAVIIKDNEEAGAQIPKRISSRATRSSSLRDQNSSMKRLAKALPDKAGRWLDSESETFFALWQADRSGDAKGALLILHAEGEHPSWPTITQPLHDTLPDYGWATMAISLTDSSTHSLPKRTIPVKTIPKYDIEEESEDGKEEEGSTKAIQKETTSQTPTATPTSTANPPQVQANVEQLTEDRLVTTLKFLHDRGQFNIAILGHGISGIRAQSFMESITPKITDKKLKEQLEKPIRAMILYNARNKLPKDESTFDGWFFDPEVPVLDIYTVHDRRNQQDARTRKIKAQRKQVSTYQQVRFSEMSRETTWGENRLSRRIRSFLEAYASGIEVKNAQIEKKRKPK